MNKQIIQQYETIRRLGTCNMYNYDCVISVADDLEFFELAALTREEYINVLMHFGSYMKKFNIEQI